MAELVVAGTSARMLAEAAALDGHAVVALDLFGDVDTRRAAACWMPLGEPGSMRLDAVRLRDGLRAASRSAPGLLGWIPGGGLEGRPELLDAGGAQCRLIGTPADAVRRVRDPALFFPLLAAHGIGHPAVRVDAPRDPRGWLVKDARGCGGWHIREAAEVDAAPSASHYFQRAMAGTPMSATFIGNGCDARLLGINRLIVRPRGRHPHVYCGCIGPVDVPGAVVRQLDAALGALTRTFGLRGWCSLDFMGDGDSISVLEVNPRPSASLALYARRGLIDAQLRACLHGELPPAFPAGTPMLAGHEIVYAGRALRLEAADAARLAGRSDVHDLPDAGAAFAAGDPVCSLSVTGASVAAVLALLAQRRAALLLMLETRS